MSTPGTGLERLSMQVGMQVRTSEGRKLGRITRIGETVLFLRPRPWGRHWRSVPLARVHRVGPGEVWLSGSASEVLQPAEPWLHTEVQTHTLPLASLPRPSA